MGSARINLESVLVGLTIGLLLWAIDGATDEQVFQVSTLTRQLPRAVVVVSSVNVAGCCCEGER